MDVRNAVAIVTGGASGLGLASARKLAAAGARVVIVEPMGSETQVTMKIGETAVNGVFRERITARPGDILPVAPQAAMAHLFSKATSERL